MHLSGQAILKGDHVLKNPLYAILLLTCLPALFVLSVVVMVKVYWGYRGFDPEKDVSPYVWMG